MPNDVCTMISCPTWLHPAMKMTKPFVTMQFWKAACKLVNFRANSVIISANETNSSMKIELLLICLFLNIPALVLSHYLSLSFHPFCRLSPVPLFSCRPCLLISSFHVKIIWKNKVTKKDHNIKFCLFLKIRVFIGIFNDEKNLWNDSIYKIQSSFPVMLCKNISDKARTETESFVKMLWHGLNHTVSYI